MLSSCLKKKANRRVGGHKHCGGVDRFMLEKDGEVIAEKEKIPAAWGRSLDDNGK